MIKTFRHKGLESFFTTGSKAGINAQHAQKLKLILSAMHVAEQADDLRAPASWRLHALIGNYAGYWSLTVNGNWRIVFRFIDRDIELVDYLDYH